MVIVVIQAEVNSISTFQNVKENSGRSCTSMSNAACETEGHKFVANNCILHVKSEPENRNEESKMFEKCSKGKRGIKKCERDRRYSCDFCKKKLTKHYIRLHMQYHTGSLPYTCTVCSRQFPFKSNLRLHYKKVHRMKQFMRENADGTDTLNTGTRLTVYLGEKFPSEFSYLS